MYPEGSFYRLPKGWTFADLAKARAKWDIPARMTALATVNGVVAWGVPMPSEYQVAK